MNIQIFIGLVIFCVTLVITYSTFVIYQMLQSEGNEMEKELNKNRLRLFLIIY